VFAKQLEHYLKEGSSMDYRVTASLSLLFVLASVAPAAYAQSAGGENLNPTQLQGRQVFAQSCGVCHLQPSLGVKTYGPVLNRSAAAGNDEVIRAFIVNGSERMPAFKYYLNPAEIDAIIAYVRTIPVPAAATAAQK
jgi:mono/diheme cytochrome c family protein